MRMCRRFIASMLIVSLCIAAAACSSERSADGTLADDLPPDAAADTVFTPSGRTAPKVEAAVTADGEVTLSWDSDPELYYEVSRTDDCTGSRTVLIVCAPGDASVYTDTDPAADFSRTYAVTPYESTDAIEAETAAAPAGTVTARNGFVLDGGYLSFYENGAAVKNTDIGSLHFDRSGVYTCGDKALDELIARDIRELTQPQMTPTEKLHALYVHLMDRNFYNYGAESYVSKDEVGWETEYAEKFMSTGLGSCFSYAALTMLYARALGFEAEAVIGECYQGLEWIWHCWTEVTLDGETYICDAEMEGIYAPNHDVNWDLFMVTGEESPITYVPW